MLRSFALSLVAVLPLAAAGCKGAPHASAVLETGGSATDWRLKSTLSARGELRLARAGASDAAGGVTAAQLQVAAAPDGQITSSGLAAAHYMPLRGNDIDLRFNLLTLTQGSTVCYANGVLLNGTSDPALCKQGDPTAFANPNAYQTAPATYGN